MGSSGKSVVQTKSLWPTAGGFLGDLWLWHPRNGWSCCIHLISDSKFMVERLAMRETLLCYGHNAVGNGEQKINGNI